jgi:hypothetical protein
LKLFQPLLVRIEPVKAVDLSEAEPHRAVFPIPLLQRVLRKAMGHINLAHLDAVSAGVADDLSRRVETHRLRIEQSAAEGVRVIMLQP